MHLPMLVRDPEAVHLVHKACKYKGREVTVVSHASQTSSSDCLSVIRLRLRNNVFASRHDSASIQGCKLSQCCTELLGVSPLNQLKDVLFDILGRWISAQVILS